MKSEVEKNLKDTLTKIESEMKEVKEKLGALTASTEESKDEGQSLERLREKNNF